MAENVLIGGGESEFVLSLDLNFMLHEWNVKPYWLLLWLGTTLYLNLFFVVVFLSCLLSHFLSSLTCVFSVSSFPLYFFNCLCAVLCCPVNIYPKDAVVIEAQKKGKFGSYAALLCLLLASETVR